MPWTRIDDRFPHHPKIVMAGARAGFLFVAGLVYCATYRTDGFIPKEALPILAPLRDYKRLAQRLVNVRAPGGKHGLWEEVEGGFQVHDYLEYQPSAEDTRQREEADRARLRSARARGVARDDRAEGEASDTSITEPATTSSRRRPVPIPIPIQSRDQDRVCIEEPRVSDTHGTSGRHEDTKPEAIAPSPAPRVEPHEGAAAIVAHLASMPRPISALATPEYAERFAAALATGLTLDEIRTAISTAGLKLGRHARADGDARAIERLASHVGSFIANQRKIEPIIARNTEPDPAADRVLQRWCDAYAKAEGATYTPSDEDIRCASEIAALSKRAASTHRDSADPGLDERIADHWIARFLDDEGVNGHLAKARHPLRYLARHVGTYGLPSAAIATPEAPREPSIAAPALSNDEHAARAANALRAIIGERPTVRKCAPKTSEADACSA